MKDSALYPICCKNEEFAELGAGYTMYFGFMKYLILGFLAISIVVGGAGYLIVNGNGFFLI